MLCHDLELDQYITYKNIVILLNQNIFIGIQLNTKLLTYQYPDGWRVLTKIKFMQKLALPHFEMWRITKERIWYWSPAISQGFYQNLQNYSVHIEETHTSLVSLC